MRDSIPLQALKHHVTGAIERREKQAIVGIPVPHIGDTYSNPRTGKCVVRRVYLMGTMDVENMTTIAMSMRSS